MTAVTEAALARLSASIQKSNSIKLSLVGKTVLWITNASRPRTFSSTRTNVLPSEKIFVSLLPGRVLRWAQIRSVRRRLLLPGKMTTSSNPIAILRVGRFSGG
jgi:hypothetical protein